MDIFWGQLILQLEGSTKEISQVRQIARAKVRSAELENASGLVWCKSVSEGSLRTCSETKKFGFYSCGG